ncbi:hypothetical protein PPERSA_04642 [Pseudocohnilembus persalinus]|uniref:Uncharacterized protein n=1 Tax=Pseudocohnilembus persalinus TaxID=266149 RepID=A0A0V0QNT1_PSEPJ|nr:hypothetical protein PPERSA_04642 [Pseudocohnilembus persalinus]|eukprot:KRX03847.1 hypothetical protein PPERSA_04642 [Pseudocohnilembus persalinus]
MQREDGEANLDLMRQHNSDSKQEIDEIYVDKLFDCLKLAEKVEQCEDFMQSNNQSEIERQTPKFEQFYFDMEFDDEGVVIESDYVSFLNYFNSLKKDYWSGNYWKCVYRYTRRCINYS